MRQMIVLLVFAFCLTTQVDAQQAADGFRIGIQAGAGPYYGLVGLVGVQVDYTITDRLRGGFRGTIVDFVGPCADPDPQLNPNPCIADGQTWLLLLSYRTERARRAVEPYIEFAGGGYRFTDQLENGEWAPFVDVETGLEIGWTRLGLRYGRAFHASLQERLDHRLEYVVLVAGIAFTL